MSGWSFFGSPIKTENLRIDPSYKTSSGSLIQSHCVECILNLGLNLVKDDCGHLGAVVYRDWGDRPVHYLAVLKVRNPRKELRLEVRYRQQRDQPWQGPKEDRSSLIELIRDLVHGLADVLEKRHQ